MNSKVTEKLEQLLVRVTTPSDARQSPPRRREWAQAREAVRKYEAMTVDEARVFLHDLHAGILQRQLRDIEDAEAELAVMEEALVVLNRGFDFPVPNEFRDIRYVAYQLLQIDIGQIREWLARRRRPVPVPKDPEVWLARMRDDSECALQNVKKRASEARRLARVRAKILTCLQRESAPAPVAAPEPKEEQHGI